MTVREHVVHKFGDKLIVSGRNFPAPAWKSAIAQMASYTWLGGLALNFFGDGIFNVLGVTNKPAFYNYLKANPMGCLGGLFVVNNLASSALSTGAFEMYLDGVLIYSKLSTNRVPQVEEVLSLLTEFLR